MADANHPWPSRLAGTAPLALVTSDAHGLYKQYGWTTSTDPERWMEIFNPSPRSNNACRHPQSRDVKSLCSAAIHGSSPARSIMWMTNLASGGTVDLLSSNKQFLARASYSPNSQIRARVWTFEDEPVDKEFFRKRIRAAIAVTSKLGRLDTVDTERLSSDLCRIRWHSRSDRRPLR